MAIAVPQFVSLALANVVVPAAEVVEARARLESIGDGGHYSEDSFDEDDLEESRPNKPNWSTVEEAVSVW